MIKVNLISLTTAAWCIQTPLIGLCEWGATRHQAPYRLVDTYQKLPLTLILKRRCASATLSRETHRLIRYLKETDLPNYP